MILMLKARGELSSEMDSELQPLGSFKQLRRGEARGWKSLPRWRFEDSQHHRGL